MRMPSLGIGFSIRAKLLLLTGILMLALVGTNLFMRSHLVAGSDALRKQTTLHDTARSATLAFAKLRRAQINIGSPPWRSRG